LQPHFQPQNGFPKDRNGKIRIEEAKGMDLREAQKKAVDFGDAERHGGLGVLLG
jgi:hypothetical protein